MSKRSIFLHDHRFPLDIFKSVYMSVIRQAIEGSKYASEADKLIQNITEQTKPIFDKFPEKTLPLISLVLRSANTYCQTLNKHPTTQSIVNILFPEMVKCLETCLDSYLIAKESGYEYNYYSNNFVNYHLREYTKRIESILGLYENITT